MIDKDKFIIELNDLNRKGDTEAAHQRADNILCEILIDLGYADIVEAYDNVQKWYS
jgi:hypothetical protein